MRHRIGGPGLCQGGVRLVARVNMNQYYDDTNRVSYREGIRRDAC